MKTGWIGLGAMGWPMAGHLHRHGHLAAVWNRSPDKVEAFIAEHPDVPAAETPAALAGQVDAIALCVSADDDLREVIAGMRESLRPGQVVVDHSTVAPATARELAETLRACEVEFIDAPVTGGVEGAIDGRLAIMAGGEAAAFERVGPVLASYSRVARRLGPAGAGQSAKAVNQLMVAGIAEAVCESLALMERLELPRDAMLELLGGGAAGNWFLEKRGRTMLDDDFETGFDPGLMLKDLRICQQLCAEAGFDSTVVRQAVGDYQRLVDAGESGRDISALFRHKRG